MDEIEYPARAALIGDGMVLDSSGCMATIRTMPKVKIPIVWCIAAERIEEGAVVVVENHVAYVKGSIYAVTDAGVLRRCAEAV